MPRRAMRGVMERLRRSFGQRSKSQPLSAWSFFGRLRAVPAAAESDGTHRPPRSAPCCHGDWLRSGRWREAGPCGRPRCSARYPVCPGRSGSGRPRRSPFGGNGRGSHRSTRPVDLPGKVQPLQHLAMDPIPQAGIPPDAQPAPAGYPGTSRHLERQPLPSNRGVEHEQDASQRISILDPRPPAFRACRNGRKQRGGLSP